MNQEFHHAKGFESWRALNTEIDPLSDGIPTYLRQHVLEMCGCKSRNPKEMIDNLHELEGRVLRLESEIAEIVGDADKKAILMAVLDPSTRNLMGRLVQPASVNYEQAKALIYQQLNIGDHGLSSMVYHAQIEAVTPCKDTLLQTTPTTASPGTTPITEASVQATWPYYNAAVPGNPGWVQPPVAPPPGLHSIEEATEIMFEQLVSNGVETEHIGALRTKGFGKGGKNNVRCHKCQHFGHFAKECYSNTTAGGGKVGGKRRRRRI